MDLVKKFLLSVNKILFLWIASLIFTIITFLLIYYKVSSVEPSVILHYNIITGVDLFGKKISLYKIPLTGLFVFAINYFISRSLKKDKEFLSFLASVLTLIVSSTLLVAVIFLLKVN